MQRNIDGIWLVHGWDSIQIKVSIPCSVLSTLEKAKEYPTMTKIRTLVGMFRIYSYYYSWGSLFGVPINVPLIMGKAPKQRH